MNDNKRYLEKQNNNKNDQNVLILLNQEVAGSIQERK